MNALAPPPPLDAAAVEAALHAHLRATLDATVYEAWFTRLKLELRGQTRAELTLPTRFLVNWTRQHFTEPLAAALEAVAPTIAGFAIELRRSAIAALSPPQLVALDLAPPDLVPADLAPPVSALPPVASAYLVPPPSPDPVPELPRSWLDPRWTFDTFHVGPSNRLAAAAARAVGEGITPYNPLCLHGAVGLGKSHLVQALAHAVAGRGRRVLYLTAERFLYGFAATFRGSSGLELMRRLDDVDMLVLDDVQFLAGRGVALEFGRIVDALQVRGKVLVVAGDRPPAELEGLDDRLRSRLSARLNVEIGPLDAGLRLSLVADRAAAASVARPGFALAPDVMAYVAEAIEGNGRDIEGAINRLLALASVTGAACDRVGAEVALRDLVRRREPRRIKIEEIRALVATHYCVERRDILSARRTANVVRPRQVAMYLAKVLTLRSLPEIGRRFGGRDHTTVLHAVRKIEALTGSDARLGEEVAGLRRMLEDA